MYETEDGRVPFREWMDDLDGNPAYDMIMRRLDKVERGTLGDCKSVGGGVIELRVDYGPGYRIYIGRDGMELVILLAGGKKNSQTSDIRKAQRYWETYNA